MKTAYTAADFYFGQGVRRGERVQFDYHGQTRNGYLDTVPEMPGELFTVALVNDPDGRPFKRFWPAKVQGTIIVG